MKNLVPHAGINTNIVPSSNNCDFQKDALLGFALDLPDDQLDTAVMQLQAAGHSLEQHNNNNNNSSSNSVDYQSLLQCADLLTPITSVALPVTVTLLSETQLSPEPSPLPSTALTPINCTSLPEQEDTLQEPNSRIDSVQGLNEQYSFDVDATGSELVNVANKDCDSLAKLAYSLWRLAEKDHIVIDRKRNEVIRTNALTNQKTIYRCMDPIGMGMRQNTAADDSSLSTKVGRPRKRASTTVTVATPESKKAQLEPAMNTDAARRTRSGRIVRPVMPQLETRSVTPPQQSAEDSLQALAMELRDKDYRCSKANNHSVVTTENIERPARTVPPNAICPGCNKIFLGRRLQRHYLKFPEHMPRAERQDDQQQLQQQLQLPQLGNGSTSTLFRLLTAQLQRHAHLNEEQRADLFLHELNDFVEQLQLRSTRLIRNTSGLHFVNARIARVLGIPEGQYALDMSAMESAQAPVPDPEPPLLHSVTVHGARNLSDYTGLSMSLDDTLTDEAAQRLNLSAGGKLLPPSEESLLRTVGDLMQPPMAAPATVGVGHVAGVNGAGVAALLPHYDHASDNAVEALNMKETPNAAILDLNVDFFQFNNN